MSRDNDTLFQQVLDQHGPALARLAGTYEHEPARAEDLYQEICLSIWKALPRWRGQSSIRTFIFRIAHNRGLTHGWRESKHRALSLQEAQEAQEARDPNADAEEKVDRRQRRRHLFAAVRELPLGLRQTVALKLEGLSGAEIAEVLGLSPGAVRVRLHRAQKILAEKVPTLFTAPTGDADG